MDNLAVFFQGVGMPHARRRYHALAACSALLVGGVLYAARPAHIVLFDWLDALGFAVLLGPTRAALDVSSLPDWLVYSVPDGCWAFAFAMALALVWLDHPRARCASVAVALAVGLGHELAQLAGWLPGTFDTTDLLAYVAACAATLAVLPWSSHDETPVALNPHRWRVRVDGDRHEPAQGSAQSHQGSTDQASFFDARARAGSSKAQGR